MAGGSARSSSISPPRLVAGRVADAARIDAELATWTRVHDAVATPEGDAVTLDGVAARLASTPGFVAAPGPLLGEHTERVLVELLGLAPDDVARLRAAGAIG